MTFFPASALSWDLGIRATQAEVWNRQCLRAIGMVCVRPDPCAPGCFGNLLCRHLCFKLVSEPGGRVEAIRIRDTAPNEGKNWVVEHTGAFAE